MNGTRTVSSNDGSLATAHGSSSDVSALFSEGLASRDPAIFEEKGEVFLLYSVAGESGLAWARLEGV